jgi:hypothetical protein
MKFIAAVVMISLFSVFIITGIKAQEKYTGTIVTKFKQEYTGTLFISINKPNSELLQFEIIEKSKQKPGKNKTSQPGTTTIKLNVALISHIIIHDTIYYFRDITYDYQSKKYMNCCMRLLSGNLDCGIFQMGNSTDINKRAIKLPNRELSELVAINFDYYTELSGWTYLAFGNCRELKEKISANQNGYSWEKGSSTTDRLMVWEKWIKEFNECKL